MKTNRNNRKRRVTVAAIAVLGLVATQTALADVDDEARVRHFQDTSTDRVPAMTAFPSYPSIARRDRIEGEATVCFKIKANGKVSSISIQSTTHKIFSKPVMRAMKKSTFEPLAPGQLLVRARTCRIYRFRLDPITADTDTY